MPTVRRIARLAGRLFAACWVHLLLYVVFLGALTYLAAYAYSKPRTFVETLGVVLSAGGFGLLYYPLCVRALSARPAGGGDGPEPAAADGPLTAEALALPPGDHADAPWDKGYDARHPKWAPDARGLVTDA